jgi:hypothetical protein
MEQVMTIEEKISPWNKSRLPRKQTFSPQIRTTKRRNEKVAFVEQIRTIEEMKT